MRFDSKTTLLALGLALFAFGCSADAADDAVNTAPIVPCTAGNCPPSSGGAGGMLNTGGVPQSSGGYVNTGGVGPASGGVPPASGGMGGGGGQLPANGGASSGGAGPASGGAAPVDPNACDVPIEFHARKDATGAKFPLPAGTVDLYECFSFKVNVADKIQALSFQPLIDNKKVVHHYLLYKMMIPQVDGATSPCIGLHRDGILIDGWAPGQEGVTLPPEVGMDIGTGDFMMEIHYNNFSDQATEDGSGLRVCATKNLRPNTATVSWLGTEAIIIPPATKNFSVTSKCAPIGMTAPINIVRSWPHMHLLGRHMKADIVRAGGTTEPLFDKAFDFNSQIGYSTPAVINPGDSVVTTCTWDNENPLPVTFGEGTGNEMCYNFTVAYPAYALQAGGLHSTSCNN